MKYFVYGIKGVGNAAIASILKDEGNLVEGMDVDKYIFTEKELRLKKIFIHPFNYNNFTKDYIYIVGHDFINSPVIKDLIAKKYNVYEYNYFIAEYIKNKKSVAICGTHGKTTTTGMLAKALEDNNISYLIGDGTGKGNKNSELFIFEACEYKDHFLVYKPNFIIITNIDYDHVDYFLTKEQYIESFNKFANNADVVFINYKDYHKINHPHIITYGFDKNADYVCLNYVQNENGISGIIKCKEKNIKFSLPIYGEHNLEHILGIISFLDYHGYDLTLAIKKLAKFTGVKRRMVQTIINDDVFIDDYAHHPNEIIATINSVRAMYPSHKVIVFFKPDRYSRLIRFKDDFITSLKSGDQSFVLPLYESVSRYHDSRILCNQESIVYLENVNDIENYDFPSEKLVFLMMSSKDMSFLMKAIVKKRESED